MSAIQEISKNIEVFPLRLKQAKEERRYTNQSLADESGVSLSSVAKLLASRSVDPKLYDVAAICRTLRLSLDELFDLERDEPVPNKLTQRIHELELEGTVLHERSELLSERVKTQKTLIFILSSLVAVLSMALVVYLLLDLSIREEGFILWGSPTAYAWAVIFMVIAAVVAIGATVYKTFRSR